MVDFLRFSRETNDAVMPVCSHEFNIEEYDKKAPYRSGPSRSLDMLNGLEELPVLIPTLFEEDSESFVRIDFDGCYWLICLLVSKKS